MATKFGSNGGGGGGGNPNHSNGPTSGGVGSSGSKGDAKSHGGGGLRRFLSSGKQALHSVFDHHHDRRHRSDKERPDKGNQPEGRAGQTRAAFTASFSGSANMSMEDIVLPASVLRGSEEQANAMRRQLERQANAYRLGSASNSLSSIEGAGRLKTEQQGVQ
ncbi:hypothetical protein CLOM_g6474 [Closterium sp. NIES-68]|nr:hypothetical protein CLOM_g17664 [Closterium sp. NIES-68]GJP36855.1 hypothetical protein CLOM_g21323 [Closterium sp. NIES-68]GJP47263.1 hypothetical protein CLOM_g6474 [Closterium sp. NIES-68]